ncbi:hypothetical protein BCR32DRAFT_294806 [Anaeromyces robustus]|uniref:RING-type domain-containing protein n=1 Tax=Anaeromyces robustus TaxID=1754192 RepID=A0A1Y1WZ45_9FUNG|nr:hypothetical protein BCR32DRAFT_294806 [Anaeromyces robustus]|eukprot:ORX78839.1 hypothetical protein BCR32DRAFT_294806 [Anaeromyces robustus]
MNSDINFIPLEISDEESEKEVEIDSNKEKFINNEITEYVKDEHKSSTKRKWDEANTCPICLSPWSSTGNHQIASLKCGHLFGYSCIVKWLKKKTTKDSRCPCCNSHAIVRNVRKLYACNIKVEDNSQYESIKKEKIEIENYCERLEKEKLHFQIYSRIANEQLICIKNNINDYKQQLKKLKQKNSNNNKFQFNSTYIIDNNLKSARVLSYDALGKYLYVTKSLNIQNFGIVKIDIPENKISGYYQLHKKIIKDIQCNPLNGNILSCSFDKTLQVFSNKTKDIDICIPIDYACWSCCWSLYNENQLFAGLSNNTILMFDIRNLSTYCTKLSGGSNLNKPIHSLIYVNNLNNSNSSEKINSGILGANLEGIFYHDQKSIDQNNYSNDKNINSQDNEDFIPKLKYQQPGSCVSLCYDPLTQQILTTWRSSSSSGLLTNYNIDYLSYSPDINNISPKKEPSFTNTNGFISSFDYMKERENKPQYPVFFERRQEIYGYSGQKHLTKNIIFSDYKSSQSDSKELNNKDAIVINESDEYDTKITENSKEQVFQNENNNNNKGKESITSETKDSTENNELETFVCASDEGSCSSVLWKCNWDNNYSIAHHCLYQELPTENHSVILDIKYCPLANTHNNILACLTGDQVFLYKK